MELVYLWVEGYKNIHHQGFNFSPRFECEYKDGTLTICDKKKKECKNNEYLENFFSKNINITAIVGENGSGKSNVLNLIFNEHIAIKVFFILKVNTELKVYGIDLDKTLYANNTIREEQLQDKVFQCTNLKSGRLDDYRLAFYSPLLHDSFTNNKDNHKNKFNLSPASLLDDYTASQQIYSKITFKDLYGIYESNAIQNSIDMIKNCKTLMLPFEIPTELTIRINKIESYEEYLPQYEFLKDKRASENSFYGYVEQRIIKNWFSNSFKNFYQHDIDFVKPILDEIEQKFGDVYSIDKLIEICPKKCQDDQGRSVGLDLLLVELKSLKDFLDVVKELSKEAMENSLKLSIQDIPNDFIIKYNKVIESCSNFLDFSWMPKLSSGQQTFLLQFSLLYKYLNNNDNTLVLIDEGETTLHPNWQKLYMKYIIDFFQSNIKNKKIHIIFSSHSPFILSDLPKENVIFLEKDENGNCKNVTKETNINTFGANIHTLLANGFFMKDGLMGEFAKEKIQSVINFLSNESESNLDQQKVWSIIHLIGEPFLKDKLLRMYDEKSLTKEEQIARLQKQIDELKNAKN